MTSFVITGLGLVLVLLSIYNLSPMGEPDVGIVKAPGYANIDPIRYIIASFLVSIPVLVLGEDNKAWSYIFLIVLVLLISQGNYKYVSRFMLSIGASGTPTNATGQVKKGR